jgi:hypothetical protein
MIAAPASRRCCVYLNDIAAVLWPTMLDCLPIDTAGGRHRDRARSGAVNGFTEFQRFLRDCEVLRQFHTWRADFIAKGVRRRRAAIVRRCGIAVIAVTAIALAWL